MILMISVVIPALNEERYIGKCLESLDRQNYSGEYEVIVIDNGSEDRTREIARKYCSRVFHEPDLELYEVRNKGIEVAKGEIIAQIDSDTVASPNWLDEVERGLRCGDLVTGPLMPLGDSSFFDIIFRVFNSSTELLINSLDRSTCNGGNCAFRKEVAKEIGKYENSFPADVVFSKNIDEIGRLYFNPRMEVYTSLRRLRDSRSFKDFCEMVFSHIRVQINGRGKRFEETSYLKGQDRA